MVEIPFTIQHEMDVFLLNLFRTLQSHVIFDWKNLFPSLESSICSPCNCMMTWKKFSKNAIQNNKNSPNFPDCDQIKGNMTFHSIWIHTTKKTMSVYFSVLVVFKYLKIGFRRTSNNFIAETWKFQTIWSVPRQRISAFGLCCGVRLHEALDCSLSH